MTLARAAGQDPDTPPAPADAPTAVPQKKEPEKGKKDGESTAAPDPKDLEHTLNAGEVAPVSRVQGTRIVGSAVSPYIHGTIAVDWRWGEGEDAQLPNTLELREAQVYVGAHILDIAQPEVFMELEQKSQTGAPFQLRYGQVDVNVAGELLVVRAGLFLVPFGVYNTDLFLRYNNHLPERPDLHRRVIPGSWSEVGLQLHGRWEWAPGRALQYAAYATNGQTGDLNITRASYDPVWRSLTGTKSVGGRLTVQPMEGLIIGASGYSGTLNAVPNALNLAGVDFIYRRGAFSADGEAMYGYRLDPGPVNEGGYYVTAGYKITEAVEPVIGTTGLTVGPDRDDTELDTIIGVNVRPWADRFPTAVLKAAWEWDFYPDPGNLVTVMFVIGF